MDPLLRVLEVWRRRHWRPGPDLVRFDGLTPVTVVTGGSDGIGLALARRFARLGNPLLLVARDPAKLAEAQRLLASEGSVEVRTLSADLAGEAGLAAVEQELVRTRSYCDVLINNAGIGLSGPFEEHGAEALTRLIGLNVGALARLTLAMLPDMLARGRGGIVNVASLGGLGPGPWQAAYYASKAFVIQLTEAVAWETRGHGVRIVALLPGPVLTEFHRRMGAESAFYLQLLPPARPASVARSAWWGYRYGPVRIVPGLVGKVLSLGLWVTPNWALAPIIGWLLKRR